MFRFGNFEFHSPWFLLLFALLIPLFLRDISARERKGIPVPATAGMQESAGILGALALLKLLKYIILSSMIIAMARPRSFTVMSAQDDDKGVDIMLTVDVSLSMLSRDLDPDRLTALQGIAKDFVRQRPNDRIGLVTYSGEAITKVPVTTDHDVMQEELDLLNPMELEPGTAIGEGLITAVNHLKNGKSKSKIVILMTDGVNTVANAMPPHTAAEVAKNNGIKVYTIGIGTNGFALMPTAIDVFGDLVFNHTEVKIDEGVLRDIAAMTGGRYFRATTNRSLAEVYQEINQLEKSDVKSRKLYSYTEYFRPFLWVALLALLLDALLRWVVFKTLQ